MKEWRDVALLSIVGLLPALEWCQVKCKIMQNECELTEILYVLLKPPSDKDIGIVKGWVNAALLPLADILPVLE